jgi:hypothetical protein
MLIVFGMPQLKKTDQLPLCESRTANSELEVLRRDRGILEDDRISEVKAKATSELRCRELEELVTADEESKVQTSDTWKM